MGRTSGWVVPGEVADGADALHAALQRLDVPFAVAAGPTGPVVVTRPTVGLGSDAPAGALPLLAWVPALTPDALGDPSFRETYGVRVNYVAGAMANGIASVEVVVAMARAGMLGFFGAAGLSTDRIRDAIVRIQTEAPGLPFGVNLIHSPSEAWQERQTVELLLETGVTTVSASAYMRLTEPLVQYRLSGVREVDGRVVVPNRVLAKVSRPEVARHFLEPAPRKLVEALVAAGRLTPAEAALAPRIPMADDLTAEADSGGHTDNRPAPVLLPLLCALRDRIVLERGYDRPVRVGAAGGLATPAAVAGAFAMGAAYVLTGTVNQACVEAGTSDLARRMLAEAGMADVGMAPASDMFEAGVEVQVLKRGTMFASRGHRLYDLYRSYARWEDVPAAERERVEQTILRRPFAEVWAECERFFSERDPARLERAARDPRHKMALVFRWYLGLASRWAIAGDEDRRQDLQIWCGPAIGAFNDWTAGTFLADPARRTVVAVAANLMAGAAMVTRARMLQHQGVHPGPGADTWVPRPLSTP